MKIIGLTGGIGSGKSTVASFLAELGAYVLDADKIGHEVLFPGQPAWQEVIQEFGKDILKPDKSIDRAKLGELVFAKPQALVRLNKIVHPRITETVIGNLKQLKNQNTKVVVVEATLLVEEGWRSMVDEVWVTIATQTNKLKRLKNRSGYSESESLSRIRSQSTDEERLKTADVLINTDIAIEEVRIKVKELWQKRIAS
jgi:dephospho-CoA kinase